MQVLAQFGEGMHTAFHILAAGANGRQIMAYLDPGSGSYLLQLLIAGLVGGALLLRAYWSRVGGFFRKLLRRNESTQGGQPMGAESHSPSSDDDSMK